MTKYHFSINNRNNFAFIDGNTIDLYTIDLIDLNLFFYKLTTVIKSEHRLLIKEAQQQYNKIGLFNNLKRTKSYTIFNVITIMFNNKKYYINLNIFPKNINIINFWSMNNSDLNNKLKKLSYDIYNLYKIFNNSVIKDYTYRAIENNNITMDNYIIEFSILKKILLEVYKINSESKTFTKTIKSSNSIGVNNFIFNEIYKPKDGFIQDIIIKKKITHNNYISILNEKLKEYNAHLDKYNLQQNIFIINQILKILTKNNIQKNQQTTIPVSAQLSRLNNKFHMDRLILELFDNKIFDTESTRVIQTHVYDMSTIWEKFLENILRTYENKTTKVLNGNKISKSEKNFLFDNEYELKYDFMISKKVGKQTIVNDIIDAKYKLPKKNYKNEILYDGNDARQVYIYLQSYNSHTIEQPTGILIYPVILEIDIANYANISFETSQDMDYESFKDVYNNNKKYSNVGLRGYELLFKEINFFKIDYIKK